ncbi:MAG: N-6 DNA methylase, partial [Pyrinomonadaceae bacterium]
ETKRIVEKAWGYAHILREEGLSYLAYIEQITFLLFLKMAHEVSSRQPSRAPLVPKGCGWDTLVTKTGAALKDHYDDVLERLSRQRGMLGDIFRKPRPEIENPRTLRRLIVDLIDAETWTAMDADVKGDIYEGLLARTASESPRGAGQYFTPRPLITAIVECIRPTLADTVCDPAAGTGGFLLAAHRFASQSAGGGLTKKHRAHLLSGLVHGWELVPNTARLCVMNLYLHGVNADPSPIHVGADALASPAEDKFSVVLTNPPFGKKGTLPSANGDADSDDDAPRARAEFWAITANKQLNFVQHVYTLLGEGGRCAIVVPDNVLFEGGAGEAVRRNLLEKCNVHTLLRLPPGIFYAQGVKANVLFFDRHPPPRRGTLWVYDLRTQKNFTLRQRQIQRTDFNEFVACFMAGKINRRKPTWSAEQPDGRWRSFAHDDLRQREKLNLDLNWLRDDGMTREMPLRDPRELADSITADLQRAVERFRAVTKRLR